MNVRHQTPAAPDADGSVRTLIDDLLAEQRELTAVDRFSRLHGKGAAPLLEGHYRNLVPLTAPRPGEQYAFEVDLDRCSGCKGCVTACHSLNGLDEDEAWREVGFLVGEAAVPLETVAEKKAGGLESRRSASSPAHFSALSPSGRSKVIPLQVTVTTACHHCVEPGCLQGCPVLAYEKDPATGVVRHLDDQCIGCSYCILKCPYEVPKYSAKRGIVRKCDLCHGRLAEGEAPACVQACPNEAIRITLASPAEVGKRLRTPNRGEDSAARAAAWLPDAPDPALTVPTTRYVTKSSIAGLRAADHDRLSPQPAHWPLVWMLLLTQMGSGMFVMAAVAGARLAPEPRRFLLISAWAILHAGLAASVFHLGQPLRAWRAFLGWRTSWMSREILLFGLLSGLASAATSAAFGGSMGWDIGSGFSGVLTWAAAGVGVLAVFSSAMIYVDTGRPCWRGPETLVRFFGQLFLLGSAGAAVTVGWVEWSSGFASGLGPALATVAFVVRTGLFVWERRLRAVARPDASHPAHLAVRLAEGCFGSLLRIRLALFVVSTVTGGLAIAGVAGLGPWWASASLLSTFTASVLKRMLFFTTATAPKMPGLP